MHISLSPKKNALTSFDYDFKVSEPGVLQKIETRTFCININISGNFILAHEDDKLCN